MGIWIVIFVFTSSLFLLYWIFIIATCTSRMIIYCPKESIGLCRRPAKISSSSIGSSDCTLEIFRVAGIIYQPGSSYCTNCG